MDDYKMEDSLDMSVFVDGHNSWLNEHVESCVRSHVPRVIFVDDVAKIPAQAPATFQFCSGYGLNPHFGVLNASRTSLMNAYPNSDALSRKDCLGKVVEYWAAKRPGSTPRKHVPATAQLSLDYSEYVEEALTAADDLTLLSSLGQGGHR